MPNWLKLIVAVAGTAGVVAGTIATGGSLAVAIGVGASSLTGSLAALFHDKPGTDAPSKTP